MPEEIADIAVVGGGPSGSLLAAELAGSGQRVALFDEKLAWEKPCGGGLTDKALERYPFLRNSECNWVRECELISPAGRRALLALDRPIAIYSRTRLNGLMLERAAQAGAVVAQDRVVRVEAGGNGSWLIGLRDGAPVRARRIAIAAGVRDRLRLPLAGAVPSRDLMATAGYYLPIAALPWPGDRMVVRFLPRLQGYIWSFPRQDHASVGICAQLAQQPVGSLRRRLEEWLDAEQIEWRQQRFYSHLLPAPTLSGLRGAALAGECEGAAWALTGDAAGLVDPITGEGLYYALRSAELLAATWARHLPVEEYRARVRAEIGIELEAAAAISGRFYSGSFLGAPVLERMIQFTARSRRFRRIMCDLFAGTQEYRSLRRRLYRALPGALAELAIVPKRQPHAA